MASTDIVPVSPLAHIATERLETEITSLAGHINAATARWLLMVAEYDRRKGWADWGCTSCAHWIAWRCGLGVNAAREHLRVARCLVDLPVITHEFESGRFSFSKVRALTRVATPQNEAELVETARRAPTSQVESMVRAFRGAVRAQELKDAKRRQVTRQLTYYYDDDGSFVIHGRLSPEEGAVVEKALMEMERKLEEEGFSAEMLEAELESEVLKELGEEAFGNPDLGGHDHRTVNEIDDARTRFYASRMTSDYARRRADALVALAERGLSDIAEENIGNDRYQVMVHVDLAALARDSLDGRCELSNGPALPPETVRRLSCDSSIVTVIENDGEILDVGRKRRTPSTPIRRALEARDRHCRFPGCANKVWVDAHHVDHWVRDEGETKLTNLVLLCKSHHRAVHEYEFSVEIGRNEVTFFRPDGTPIATPEPLSSDPALLVALNNQLGLDIDEETTVPEWYGDRWDYDVTVARLLEEHGFGVGNEVERTKAS